MESNRVTILGARGSVPVSGAEFARYGGATACVLLEAAEQVLVFDAGTGFLKLPTCTWTEHKKVHVFLSHLHLDHLLGIPMSRMMYDRTAEVVFYAEDAQECEMALRQIMKEPLWPVGTETFGAKITYQSMGNEALCIPDSAIAVTAMPVSHPGGCLAYRADWEGRSLVYATDCELDAASSRDMAAFAKGAQQIILDAQYTKEETEKHRGFGHTDVGLAASVIAASGAAGGRLFHHAPTRTDAQLAEIEAWLQQHYPQVLPAKEGEVVIL